ncbi:Aste57867_6189 [Aphanomyces stellatus]|uniref:Aste57867_6189 protein n=1 Tax=Aphanomyces stellatus TaxID=120398 RepID=A0A485KHR1_9STRA|nr:hypothetical protein As57867_006175 [Aphanomyces stellatus]VFT83192.1 Aste57867_6189 [Aphanomyces stellatus]
MTALLQRVYNNTTFPFSPTDTLSNDIFLKHIPTATYAIRYPLALPANLSDDHCLTTLIRFPGEIYYGRGVRQYICAFLAAANQTAFIEANASICQHEMILGAPLADGCLWLTPSSSLPPSGDANNPTTDHHSFVVYFARQSTESPVFAWFKFTFRTLLTLYILHLVWSLYFCHYIVLMDNLRHSAAGNPLLVHDGPPITSFVVVVGDPTYFILSHPTVSFILVLDVWLSAVYFGLATIHVSQMQEMGHYVLGCFYGSRTVWFAYFTMRVVAVLVKQLHLEHRFASVDPGILAVAVVVYAGPLAWLFSNSFGSSIFHFLWSLVGTSSQQLTTIEIFPGIVFAVSLLGSFPIGYSMALAWWSDRQSAKSVAPLNPSQFASATYNDFKQRFLLFLRSIFRSTNETEDKTLSVGGTLHRLFRQHAGYRKLPLFSLRASDCFVECRDANKIIVKKLRLSLLAGLDRQEDQGSDTAIRLCPIDHLQSFCTINMDSCLVVAQTTSMQGPTVSLSKSLLLHIGASQCEWVL